MQPNIWGKPFWTTIHIAALGYQDNPTLVQRKNYQDFYLNLGNVLPCKKCSLNYKRHLEELPIFAYLDSNKRLFEWTVILHNIVNRELGKQQWNLEYAYTYYTTMYPEESTKYKNELVSDPGKKSNNESKQIKQMQYIMIGVNVFLCIIILHLVLSKRK
jgi:hypothetical protein